MEFSGTDVEDICKGIGRGCVWDCIECLVSTAGFAATTERKALGTTKAVDVNCPSRRIKSMAVPVSFDMTIVIDQI